MFEFWKDYMQDYTLEHGGKSMDKFGISETVFLVTGSCAMKVIGGGGDSTNLDPVLCEWMDDKGKKVSRNFAASELTKHDIRAPHSGDWNPETPGAIVQSELPTP